MININKILIEVRRYFHKNLPDHLTYHNWAHTLSVYRNVQHIGKKENLSIKEIDLLKIAALFHDIGYIESKNDHEKRGCEMMEEWLINYNVASQDMQEMKGMIMATKIPQNPTNHLERVIADADLLYLGTNKYEVVSEKLYSEFQYYDPQLDQYKWNKLQIEFLSTHKYQTVFCQRYYEWKKQNNLSNIVE